MVVHAHNPGIIREKPPIVGYRHARVYGRPRNLEVQLTQKWFPGLGINPFLLRQFSVLPVAFSEDGRREAVTPVKVQIPN